MALGQGAGIQSAQLMAERGVTAVLTGNCGPNAHKTLSAVGISVIVGCAGGVKDVIEQFKAGKLNPVSEPTSPVTPAWPARRARLRASPRHLVAAWGPAEAWAGVVAWAVVQGVAAAMGRGAAGANPGPAAPPAQGQSLAKGDELAMLRQQAESIAEQMQQIQQRIQQLEQEG